MQAVAAVRDLTSFAVENFDRFNVAAFIVLFVRAGFQRLGVCRIA